MQSMLDNHYLRISRFCCLYKCVGCMIVLLHQCVLYGQNHYTKLYYIRESYTKMPISNFGSIYFLDH